MADLELGVGQPGPSTVQPQPAHLQPPGSTESASLAVDPSLYAPSARSPASVSPAPSDAPALGPPQKRQRLTEAERAERLAHKAITKPTPVRDLEGDDEVVRAKLKEMTPERVGELKATLARQEGLYAEAYAALAAELKRAQVEEAVLKNVKKVHEEEFARAEYQAVATKISTRTNTTSSPL